MEFSAPSSAGGDGLACGNEGVHHRFVAHDSAAHIGKLLECIGEHGLELGSIHRIALGRLLLQAVEPGVPQGHRASAVENHDLHSNIVEHLLNAALRRINRAFDGIGYFAHSEPMVGIAKMRVDFSQLVLRRAHLRTRVLQAYGQFVLCNHVGSPFG